MNITALLLATTISTPNPDVVESKIVGASLFKNGYAVITRETPLPIAGEVLIAQPSGATLGTLWVTASSGIKIQSVVSTKIVTDGQADLSSLDELLTANVGRTLLLEMGSGELNRTLTGTILSANGSLLVLQLADGSRIGVHKNTVRRITSRDGELVFQKSTKTSKNALRIRATGAGSLYTISLERGLTWAPGYHVDITDEKKLKITSKATILNDTQDLDDVDVRLITGFPHVRFINILDPLSSGNSIDQFLNAMMSMGLRAPGSGGALTQNAVFAGARMAEQRADAGGFQPFDVGQLEGMQLEDLFFYTQEGVSLKRGERGYYVLFQEEAEYEHVYTLDLPETGWWQNANVNVSAPIAQKFDVWHTLEFENPTSFPLTTAAATTFKNGEIIGQDMLSYVAPKGKAHLKITKALDIQTDLDEQEVDREIAAIKRTSYTRAHDLVSAKGTIEVVNYKSETVTVKVTKWLVGEVSMADRDGTTIKNRAGLRSLNPNSEIRWTLELKPGERVELKYEFKVYVPTP
ncbi:MAG: hypothetical protein IH944_10445 [Armatimonadetes bacterium]|nr:hypothetical protein [Armatimonadota bacterium]